mgnify:CR=1 FL=1
MLISDPIPVRSMFLRELRAGHRATQTGALGRSDAAGQHDHSVPGGVHVLSAEDMANAFERIRSRADYAPTPLAELPGLARMLGLGGVQVKDESQRFGLGGVKALGAPYGLWTELERLDLRPDEVTAIAATDGNHGLALAWAARELGCRARIFVGSAVDRPRVSRIADCGAEVVVIDGTYDDAVAAAEAAAAAPGAVLISDTDYVGDIAVTRAIMAGYSVLAQELCAQTEVARLTHVFLQCGVGGVAAGIVAGLQHGGEPVPKVVAVEPERAASMLASLEAGRPVRIEGDLHTRMIGLACGRPSAPAWEILRETVFAAMTVEEECAVRAQALLARGVDGDPPLQAGDTGIAGIAALCSAAEDPAARARLGLDENSRVLLINSEGPGA